MQSAVLVLIGFGLKATFQYTNHNNSPNLSSLHSWVGVFTVSLFMANYFAGIVIFANPCAAAATKATFMPIHQFLGVFTFVLSCFQVLYTSLTSCLSLARFADKTSHDGCRVNGWLLQINSRF